MNTFEVFALRKNIRLNFALTKDDSDHAFSYAKDGNRPNKGMTAVGVFSN